MKDTKRRRKAGAYARVSTRKEDQLHSFSNQKEYWEERIKADPALEFVGLWADEGISGKSLNRRQQFLEMVECAKAGQVDIIFVKSVTRFGRNFMDIIATVRELRDHYGVTIHFEEENLYTDDVTAELELSIRAVIAEQEIIDMSENQKWSIRQRLKKGLLTGGCRLYGYKAVADEQGIKRLVVVPQEAKVIRYIYSLYLDGKSLRAIADELSKEKIPTMTGLAKWSPSIIRAILTNEKMTGDTLLQKTYRENFQVVINKNDNPEAPLILIENDHEAIIDKGTFTTVQARIASKMNQKSVGRKMATYEFSRLMKCGVCGCTYRRKVYQYKGKGLYGLWVCGEYATRGKKGCDSRSLKESVLHELFMQAFNQFVDATPSLDSIKELEARATQLRDERMELSKLMINGYINEQSFRAESEKISEELLIIDKEIATKSQANLYKAFKKKITEYDATLVGKFLKDAIVRDWTVAFVFKNGVIITLPYTNGTAGNKEGWSQNALARKHNQPMEVVENDIA